MQQSTDLQNMLHSIHRKSYPAYKSLKGAYQFGHYIFILLTIVQGRSFLPLPLISASGFLIKLPVFRKNICKILLQKLLSVII